MVGKICSKKPESVRMFKADKKTIFEDEARVGDQELNDDDIIYAVFKSSGDGWEKIEIPVYSLSAEKKGGKKKKKK
jgi:hypothetical protein